MSLTYKDAGVDIDAGNQLVKKIAPMVARTKRAGTIGNLGGFGGLFDLKAENFSDPILVSGTDGVGTKLKVAIDCNLHHTVGIDLVAMCVNDVLVQGAEPLFFLDYFATGGLDVDVAASVIEGITKGCEQAECSLIGGETAEMPGFYPSSHYDLAGFCVGAVERENLLPKTDSFKEGDILIGLPSSGFHSNGFSLVRKIIEVSGLTMQSPCPWDTDKRIGESLLEPTIIYVKQLKEILREKLVNGMVHITGGGLTENLPRVIGNHLSFHIDLNAWKKNSCFDWVQKTGTISDAEMLKTFNCGIGMVLIVSSNNLSQIKTLLEMKHQPYYHIGSVMKSRSDVTEVIYDGRL